MGQQLKVRMHGDLIKQLRKDCGFATQEKLAAAANNIDVRSVRDAERGEEVTVTTAVAIHAALESKKPQLKYEDLIVLPASDSQMSVDTSATHTQAGVTVDVAFTHDNVIIKLAASPQLLEILKLVQWNDILKQLISALGRAVIKKINKGSVVLTVEADDTAMKDFADSLLAWRLQYVGIYDVRINTYDALRTSIVDAILAHFHFPNIDMRARCSARLLSRGQTTLATASGLHIVQLNPPEDLFATSEEIEAAWKLAHAAHAATLNIASTDGTDDTDWHAALEGWQTAEKAWKRVAEEVAEYSLSDLAGLIAAGARQAISYLYTAQNAARQISEWKDDTWASPPFSTLRHASQFAMLLAGTFLESSRPWERAIDGCDVWRFRSTLLPSHISASGRYWSSPTLEDIPQQARFPEDNRIHPQPAILLDDETFLNQLPAILDR